MRLLPLVAAATAAFLVVACSSPTPPRGVTVVNNFDAKRYLGTWYEIARFDHRFERGLEKVTATYSLRDDGGLNRCRFLKAFQLDQFLRALTQREVVELCHKIPPLRAITLTEKCGSRVKGKRTLPAHQLALR